MDKNGEGISYDYDADGRKIRTHYPDGGVERSFYDAEGNLIKKVTPNHYDQSTDDGSGTTYTYDAGNRRTSVKNEAGDLLEVSRYDAKGRCVYHQYWTVGAALLKSAKLTAARKIMLMILRATLPKLWMATVISESMPMMTTTS